MGRRRGRGSIGWLVVFLVACWLFATIRAFLVLYLLCLVIASAVLIVCVIGSRIIRSVGRKRDGSNHSASKLCSVQSAFATNQRLLAKVPAISARYSLPLTRRGRCPKCDSVRVGVFCSRCGYPTLKTSPSLAETPLKNPEMPVGIPKSRTAIPRDVQREVWRRDQGRCIQCGSQERLEIDHMIPVSKGGSNTARNLQLLCEMCNRSKGNRI